MSDEPKVYAVDTIAPIAVPKSEEMLLTMTSRVGDPDFIASLPARAVGALVVELSAQLCKMPVNPKGDAMAVMKLTGAQPLWTQDDRPTLLLQLNNQIDIALTIEPKNLEHLARAVERLRAGPTRAPSKPQ